MAEFADRMKSFTDHLRGSIRAREESLAQVHAATEQLRDDARTFLGHLADEHRARAEDLHATLASHREERNQKVSEMRHGHQDSLRKMREDLTHMLSQSRKVRQDAVHAMTESFQQTRHDLADDLREASNAWSSFAARVAFDEAAMEDREEATQPHTTTSTPSGRNSHRKPAHGKRTKARQH
jgi:uncharacterized coiled-coil DUF342 family protein